MNNDSVLCLLLGMFTLVFAISIGTVTSAINDLTAAVEASNVPCACPALLPERAPE